jgi:hypothetical protein
MRTAGQGAVVPAATAGALDVQTAVPADLIDPSTEILGDHIALKHTAEYLLNHVLSVLAAVQISMTETDQFLSVQSVEESGGLGLPVSQTGHQSRCQIAR